jgi:hypothetical protein
VARDGEHFFMLQTSKLSIDYLDWFGALFL